MPKKLLFLSLSLFSLRAPAESVAVCASVTVASIEIVCIGKGVGTFSAIDRAQAMQEKIKTLSRDVTFDTGQFQIAEVEGAFNITAGDLTLASFREGDVKPEPALTPKQSAEKIVERLRSAIERDRELRSPAQFTWGLIYSALATLGFVGLLILLNLIYPKIYARVRISGSKYLPSLKIKTIEVLSSARLVGFMLKLAEISRFIVTLVGLYIYVPLVLSFFPATSNWSPKIYKYVMDPLRLFAAVTLEYIPKFFFIFIIVLITRYLLRAVQFIFLELERGTIEIGGFYKEWSIPTYKLVRILIVAFAFVMAFPYLPGSSSPAFQGVSVFLGILVSLGSSSAIGNIVAGVVITYMRPFKLGDRVKIAETVGDVLEKTLLVTRIRTIKNEEITIPNSAVLNSHIVNYSSAALTTGLIVHTTVTIGYDAPWRQVHELLISAAEKTDLVDFARKPFVLQTALDDFYIHYQINAFTRAPNQMAVIYSNLHQNIQDLFNAAGVEIMSSHYSNLRDGNETTIPANYRAADYVPPSFRT